jgi:esterase/lipase
MIENKKESKQATLFFPGNTSDILEFKDKFQGLKEKNIIIINYRKKNCKFGNYRHAIQNAEQACQYVFQTYDTIHVMNYSIGNGIFADILPGLSRKPKTITILGGISNMKDLLYYRFGYFSYLFAWVLSKKFNTIENILKYVPDDVYILIVHGDKDKIVPVQFAKQMHKDLLYAGKNVSIQIKSEFGHSHFDHENYIL